ncbi:DUF2846 domain-containing protein [Ralstonia sp. UBA689]|uniref:DUF2846 domain-containing protein n=1 Tax=Ralstonia sp. UBA689 TaxID=1947373 RepID=UPI0025DE33AB|nr:DUF2846 domain-containing protein [Ralstonia sp. UBA689]
MKQFARMLLIGLAAAFLLGACASGVKHADMAASIPTLKAGEGRIYFLRSSSMLGAAVQPDIRLNGEVVGVSKPGGFFFVDRPAGKYVVSAATETEKTLHLTLSSGETKYVRSSPSVGIVVGRVVLSQESEEDAVEELAGLSYTGELVKSAAK